MLARIITEKAMITIIKERQTDVPLKYMIVIAAAIIIRETYDLFGRASRSG